MEAVPHPVHQPQQLWPRQHAVAVGLRLDDDFFAGYTADMQAKRDRLSAGLADAGLDVLPTQGTYFASCDITSIGETNGIDFCLALPERAGVVAVPSMVFFDNQDEGASIIRFAFCKKDEVIDEAVARLKAGLS